MSRQARALGWLLGVGVLVRLVLWAVYQPVEFGDSGSYWLLARQLATGDFVDYLPKRTPGYPLLLLVGGFQPVGVWLAQSLLGLTTSWLLFDLGRRVTGRLGVGLTLGLAYSLTLHFVLLEAAILTETLATFLVTGLAWVVVRGVTAEPALAWRHWLLAGLLSGAAILVRPSLQLVLVPVAVTIWMQERLRFNRMVRAGHIGVVVLVSALVAGSWALANLRLAGRAQLTGMGGLALMDHTGGFIEHAPARYAVLRDIYLKHRALQIARHGTADNAVVHALPEWRAATGLSYAELSRQCQEMSVALIVAHPVLYLQSVTQAWWHYWKARLLWQPERVRSGGVRAVLAWFGAGQRILLIALNGLFLWAIAGQLWRDGTATFSSVGWWPLFAAAPQILLAFESSGRYAIPFQPLVWLALAAVIWPRRPAGAARLRVCMVCYRLPPVYSGAGQQALTLAQALRPDHEVFFLTGRPGELPAEEVRNGIAVYRLRAAPVPHQKDWRFAFALAWRLWRWRDRYDLVHTHGYPPHYFVALAMLRLLAKPNLIKLSSSSWDSPTALRTGRLGGLRQWTYRWIGLRVAPSTELRELCERAPAGLGWPVIQIPNAVDTERFQPATPARRAALRQQLGWPVDSLVVLYVGRISEAKGAADLLLAWADVQPLERSARLVLAGPAGENAQALTRGSGVEWLGPRADVAELLAAADVFVLASRQEGMPNALLEAAAAGLPAVSYTVAGARDIVADEVSGLCVPVGDVTGLAAGLRRLLTDPTCRAQMGAAARTRVVERFDVAVVAAQYRRAYTQLLTGGIPLDSHRMCT